MDTVAEIRQTIKTHAVDLSKNEMMTRYALIDPLLRELGWDLSNPSDVVPEEGTGFGKTDYTLGGNAMIVEAKKLDENLDKHADKLISYVRDRKVRYGVLTNGQKWRMYDADATTKSPEIEFDITDSDGVVLSKAIRLHRMVLVGNISLHTTATSPDDDGRSGILVDVAPWSAEQFDTITYKGHAWTAKKHMVDLLVSVAEWLVREGHLTAKHCPIKTSSKNYLLHTEPKHQNGRPFHSYRRLEKRMYLNVAYDGDYIIRHSIGLMEAVGLDRSEIRLENRRL